ncbi:MAG: ankyrin repeat domain-containing protein [Calothrix sp. SM1_7_51]|nr:ankyrin repeat domain-containing protein [Calothrix sp. SM1_7_51]
MDIERNELVKGRGELVGDNQLHTAARNILVSDKQIVEIQRLVTDGDVNYGDTNQQGHIALTLAALHGNRKILPLLMLHEDINHRLPQGYTALDLAMGKGWVGIPELLLANGAKSGIDDGALTPIHLQNLSTVEILVRATLADSDEATDRIRQAYEELYTQEQFRPVMDVAARKAIGPVDNNFGVLRIYALSSQDVSWMDQGLAAGSYGSAFNVLKIGSKKGMDDMKGTLIHELTHHAAHAVFGNDQLPFSTDDLNAFQVGNLQGLMLEYVRAIQADLDQMPTGFFQRKLREVYDKVIPEAETGYLGKGTPAVNIAASPEQGVKQMTTDRATLEEIIVRIPQRMVEYGVSKITNADPNLTRFFLERFNQACRTWVTNHQPNIPTKVVPLTVVAVTAPVDDPQPVGTEDDLIIKYLEEANHLYKNANLKLEIESLDRVPVDKVLLTPELLQGSQIEYWHQREREINQHDKEVFELFARINSPEFQNMGRAEQIHLNSVYQYEQQELRRERQKTSSR